MDIVKRILGKQAFTIDYVTLSVSTYQTSASISICREKQVVL